jgi:putative transcriptional regulator
MKVKLKLQEIMKDQGISIAQLAAVTGITRANIYLALRPDAKGIKYETLAVLCRALDCNIADLLVLEVNE